MAITPLPTPPAPTDTPAQFNTKAFALLGALPTFVTETNALAVEVDADATTATTQAGIATTQAGTATTQASAASASATLAGNWAIKTDAPVSGGEYSAKYWAQVAQGVVATIPEGTINDATTSPTGVWSSQKVSTELAGKASASSVQTLAQIQATALCF